MFSGKIALKINIIIIIIFGMQRTSCSKCTHVMAIDKRNVSYSDNDVAGVHITYSNFLVMRKKSFFFLNTSLAML